MSRQGAAYLFVPGNRPERFDKAVQAAPGMVIIDLEDAVPIDQKDRAREAVAAWVSASADVIVRINAEGTPWFYADLKLVLSVGVRAVMLPKAESVVTVQRVARAGRPVIPLIETGKGMAGAREIARQESVERLAFGSIDLKVDLGLGGDDEELNYFRSELVLASRLAEIGAPIDGVSTEIKDQGLVRQEAERARRFGFASKLCIHPNQLDVVTAAFSPSEREITWANQVMKALSTSDGGAVSVDGKMVDKPVIALATRILANA